MDDDQRARRAIDRLAKRIKESDNKVGGRMTFEEAQQSARRTARRVADRD